MEKTENFNLNQWDPHDEIKVEDFNADNAAIDAALKNLSAERVAVGSYTGDGAAERIIPLPFTPKMVLLFVQFGSSTVYERMYVLTDSFRFSMSDSFIGFSTSGDCGLLESGLKVGGTATNYASAVNHYIAFA